MSAPLRLRTVYDATRTDEGGHLAAQLRLHVASWHRNAKSAAALTVTAIGEPARPLRDYLEAAEAEIEIAPGPHRLYARSPIYNKHLVRIEPGGTERSFLTDNDTIYLADVVGLEAIPADAVGVTLPDLRRVTPELWEELRADLDLTVIPLDWVPWKERAQAQIEGRPANREKIAYFNGGAILFPAGDRLWRAWEAETARLSAYLERRGLHDRKDAGSDQLSLTSTVAAYGNWAFLPPGYNVRPFHFWQEDGVAAPVVHLHMVNTGRAARAMESSEAGSLSALLRRYWEMFILGNARPEYSDLAQDLLARSIALVRDYDIERMQPAS